MGCYTTLSECMITRAVRVWLNLHTHKHFQSTRYTNIYICWTYHRIWHYWDIEVCHPVTLLVTHSQTNRQTVLEFIIDIIMSPPQGILGALVCLKPPPFLKGFLFCCSILYIVWPGWSWFSSQKLWTFGPCALAFEVQFPMVLMPQFKRKKIQFL